MRPLEMSDVPQIVEILTELEVLEPAGQHWSESELAEDLGLPGIDLRRGSIGILDGERLVAFGYLAMSAPSDTWVAYAHGGVRTDRLGCTLGRQILEALRDQAIVLRDDSAAGSPGELKLWVPEPRMRLLRLAAALGFQPWRYFQDMRHELGELPARPQLPDGVRIARWSPELDEGTRLASNESFADHWGSIALDVDRWRAYFADSNLFRPAQSVLAVDDVGVVSFVLVEEFPAETDANGVRTGYLSRVGTARRGRGRGVASALLVECLHALDADGFRRAELTVDSDSPTGAGRIYDRVGFRPTQLNRALGIRFP